MKKTAVFILVLYFLLPFSAISGGIKNVILLIPDGMSPQAAALARMYNGKALNLDAYACGMVTTFQAEGPVTDSASAATAMSTGFKTNAGFIACLPEKAGMPGVVLDKSRRKAPVATILEAAKQKGLATGIVATSWVQHATPASFTGHYPDRDAYEILAEQQVYISPDVVLGGGFEYLENRRDGENLVPVIKSLGYEYVTKPGEMKGSSSRRLWGMFEPKDLKYDFDRKDEYEPSLEDMTKKAIELLSKDEDGFFLVVEGSKIDWAAHANDPVALVTDILAFDKAAGAALEFAKNRKDTIVIAAADHCTGGLSIGNKDTSDNYDSLEPGAFISLLKKARCTGDRIFKQLYKDRANLKQVMKDWYGVEDLNIWEQSVLQLCPADKFMNAAGPMLSGRANIGWSTNGHDAGDVTLYCFDPRGKGLTGVIDNTRIASYMKEALGLDLKAATDELFIPVSSLDETFEVKPSYKDVNNPELVLKKSGKIFSLPANKNVAVYDGKKYYFTGITVYNGKDWFVPSSALELIRKITE